MRILLDQGTPAPLRHVLSHHEVSTAYECGWATLSNGELLEAAEANAFAVLVTTDTNLKYQQNLKARRVAIVVLSTTSWPRIRTAAQEVVRTVDGAAPGSYADVHIP